MTAKDAYLYMNKKENVLREAGALLKTKPEQVPDRIDALHKEMKELQKEKDSLSAKLSNLEASSILDDVEEVAGVKVLAKKVDVKDMNSLRSMVDDLKQKLGSGIILLAAPNGEKVQLIAGVSKDLVEEGYHAGQLIKEAAAICGGGGGGRPDMAQAGGKDASKIPDALTYAKEYAGQKA